MIQLGSRFARFTSNQPSYAAPFLAPAASQWQRYLATINTRKKTLLLCILDGWGHREEKEHNAIAQAHTPVYDNLLKTMPWGLLNASEKQVGLPKGQIGNSEVGHMNLGAGRIVYQDIMLIDKTVDDGELSSKLALRELIAKLDKSGGTCHLMGLVSPGGVHALQSHIAALANAVTAAGVPVAIHVFTDGRDTPPQDALNTLPAFLASLNEGSRVVTVTGRYWALDRDKRWDRVKKAYDAIVHGQGEATAANPANAVAQFYTTGKGDEFVSPTIIGEYTGMKDGDGVLFANFRADRAREILTALVDPKFDDFECGKKPHLAAACGMVVYSEDLGQWVSAIFPPKELKDTLGDIISKRKT